MALPTLEGHSVNGVAAEEPNTNRFEIVYLDFRFLAFFASRSFLALSFSGCSR